MNRIASTIALILCTCCWLSAQELDFQVSVNAQAVASADPKTFEQLESELTELLNRSTWTEDTFEDHEKISGQMTITITKELSATSFEAELAIVTGRPVYKSTYNSQLIKYLDRNVIFSYDGIRPIQKSDNNYLDNLSSVITYYVYFILGMDYDSFSPNGGQVYFDKAFDVYNALPSGLQRSDKGWTNQDNTQQNRYFLLENARSPSLKGFRNAFYEYHRLGMDTMHEDPARARAVLLSAITQVGQAQIDYGRSILVRMFSDAKELEIIQVFEPAAAGEKQKVREIMSEINPQKSSAYKSLR